MADYLKIFATKQDYDNYIAADYPRPNVSFIEETDEVIYTNYQLPEYILDGIRSSNWSGNEFVKASQYIGRIYIPEGVETVADHACEGSLNLEFVKFPSTLVSIGVEALFSCPKLDNVILPDSLETINDAAFEQCISLSNIKFGKNITDITYRSFAECSSLQSVDLPEALETLGKSAFEGCTNLETVVIHAAVTSIGDNAFIDDSSLTSLTVEATTPPTLGEDALQGTHADLEIFVPADSVNTYKAAAGWSTYASQIFPIA